MKAVVLDSQPLNSEFGIGKGSFRAITVLALWFVGIWFASANGWFETGPRDAPTALLIALFFPVAAAVGLYLGSKRFRLWVDDLDLALLTALQSWRVLGGGFLHLYAWNVLPGLFALPAGLGDMAVGFAAPFFAVALTAGRAVPRRALIGWNILGIADFAVAFATGLATSGSSWGFLAGAMPSDPMQVLPLVLIPAFAVPSFILLHVASLVRLRSLDDA